MVRLKIQLRASDNLLYDRIYTVYLEIIQRMYMKVYISIKVNIRKSKNGTYFIIFESYARMILLPYLNALPLSTKCYKNSSLVHTMDSIVDKGVKLNGPQSKRSRKSECSVQK